MSSTDTRSRRRFLGTILGATTAATLPMATTTAVAAEIDSQDAWLADIDGKHKCLFDFPAHKNGAGLVHIFNYITTYQMDYDIDSSDIATIGTLYSAGPASSVTMAFNDAMWEKYRFGEYHSLDDPGTGKPATRNLFYKHMDGDELPRVGAIGPFPDASVSALQEKSGTVFLLCNNAMMATAMDLSRLGRGQTEEIYADLKANIQPGVHLVPAMVIAIERAQAAGIAYNKQ